VQETKVAWVVGVATNIRAGRFRVRITAVEKDFSPKPPGRLWGAPSLQFNGYQNFFPGVKRPGLDVDHSPTCIVDIKNDLSYTSTPHIRFHGVDRDEFAILLPGCNEAWNSQK
jgi:hypothetical protein